MVVLTEGVRKGAAIMSEGNFHISRENGKVPQNTTILVNGLVARIAAAGLVAIVQSYAGTGNGLLTLASPAYAGNVKDGNYKVTCITAAANGGIFRVEDPDGNEIGNATVGQAFNKAVKFTIADGATDFVVGDEFILNVQADDADFSIVAFNPAGTDGSEKAYGYSPYGAITGANQTAPIAILARLCELNVNCINWPVGITDVQKADAKQALAENNIILR